MFIYIEDAPVLVICRAMSALGHSEIGSTFSYGLLDKLQWRSMEFVDNNDDVLAMDPVPVRQVDRLGLLPFSEDQDGSTLPSTRWLRAPRPATAARGQRGSPTVLAPTSMNSCGATIGVAPYRPAR